MQESRLSLSSLSLETPHGHQGCFVPSIPQGGTKRNHQDLRNHLSCTEVKILGSFPTTPDLNTSAEASQYRWEQYPDTSWWCVLLSAKRRGYFCESIFDRNGRCIAILFRSIGVRSRFEFSDLFGYFFGIFRLFRVFFETFLQTPKKTPFETFLRFRARRARRLL